MGILSTLTKIRRREAKIAVIGLGHIGLPTATLFANANFTVMGMDVDLGLVESLLKGESPTKELDLGQLAKRMVNEEKLKPTACITEAVMGADAFVICVPTPLADGKEPDLTYLEKACRDVAKGVGMDRLVAIESTVPPGTTRSLVTPLLEKKTGLRSGRDFWVAHCPSRVLPGNALRDIIEGSRVIGGDSGESVEIAVELYKTITKGDLYTTDLVTAETVKLAENTFRDVNIALANELALVCEQIGVDVMDVIRLANTHPRVNLHRPGCGVGGPCLPKDPYLLLHPAGRGGLQSKIIGSAREINDYMPMHTVERVIEALTETGRGVRDSRITVLGVTYRGDVDDVRNSPAERIVRELTKTGVKVRVYDPCSQESFEAEKAVGVMEAVKGADCIVIATDHKAFKSLNLTEIKSSMREKPVIVDGRRVLDPEEAMNLGFRYYGIGKSRYAD